jgi:transposase
MASHDDAGAAGTLWRMPDDLWEACERILPPEKPPGTPGRPAVPFRRVLDGILHVLRTGCQWKAVPREFGSGSTIHARFQEWTRRGVWRRLWAEQLRRYDRAHGIGWDRQSADSATVPSPPRRRRDRAGSDQSRETRHQAAPAERPARRPPEPRAQRRQSPRHEGGRGHSRRARGRSSAAHRRPPAAPGSRQGLRLPRDGPGRRGTRLHAPHRPQAAPGRSGTPAACRPRAAALALDHRTDEQLA